MSDDLTEVLEVAVRAARRGGEVLRRLFLDSDLRVEEKARNDFVSRADRESESVILEEILGAFPDHRILAEESGARPGADGELEWIVDPLDGTTNYLRGLPYFCVSIACLRAGSGVGVVFDPLRDDLFSAESGRGARRNGEPLRVDPGQGLDRAMLATGFPFKSHPALDLYLSIFQEAFRRAQAIRRCGAAALDLAYTAAGVYDGFFEFRLAPWDLAAGCLLIEEAGGSVSDLDGGRGHLASGSVVAGGRRVQAELLEVVRGHVSEESLAAVLDPE